MPVTNLINKCMKQNVFPDIMKCAEISPIFKKNDALDKNNYRPVSILTGFSKLYESSMDDQLSAYFSGVLNDFVNAFRMGYSCQSLLVKAIDDWKCAVDNNDITGVLSMDLSKAFDCLPHSLLIAKLSAYGISDDSCQLVGSYLSSRKQRVKIGQHRSSWSTISKGVPQGSILGPLLFNIFINDIFHFIEHCKMYNYADDNTMSLSAPSLNEVKGKLQNDTHNAIQWFIDNGMVPNPSKFQFMVISNKKKHPTFRLQLILIQSTLAITNAGNPKTAL